MSGPYESSSSYAADAGGSQMPVGCISGFYDGIGVEIAADGIMLQ